MHPKTSRRGCAHRVRSPPTQRRDRPDRFHRTNRAIHFEVGEEAEFGTQMLWTGGNPERLACGVAWNSLWFNSAFVWQAMASIRCGTVGTK